MTYKNAIDFLYSQLPMFSRVGAAAYKPGLETSLNLDNFFGNPHKKFKSIHVGGTNGKGSTSHTLAAILQSQGYKVGLYTSPHLVDFRERMRVNGEMIPEEKVIEFVEKWKESDYNGHPSFFELTMIMAFNWFAEEKVDYAVIEVGMGGRLDSTNIITPELCVITNISNDHTQFLGATLPEIAHEKAGIIKSDIPVVIGEAEGEIRNVFSERAKEVGAPIVFSEDTPRIISIGEYKGLGNEVSSDVEPSFSGGWKGESKEGKWVYPLSGDYQIKNLNTVFHAIDGMRKVGIEISDESVIKGIEGVETLTGLRGRWTIVNRYLSDSYKRPDNDEALRKASPLIIADTGHNIAGISYNMAQLERLMLERPEGQLRIVIGFVADKAIDKILRLLPKDAIYYITNAMIPRALPAEQLKERFLEAGLDGTTFADVESAFSTALEESDSKDIIFVGGSTFIVADLFSFIEKKNR